jgi:hypothetical protein
MEGHDILRGVEKYWLQEALNLSVQAEVSSFIKDNIEVTDKHGFFRFVVTGKNLVKNVRTQIGTIKGIVPIVRDRDRHAMAKISFNSKVFPNRMVQKHNYDSSMAWRFIEGLAIKDFTGVRQQFLDVFSGCDKRRLSPYITQTFTAKLKLWEERSLAEPAHGVIWLDKIQLHHKGPFKDYRLYVAAGITPKGAVNLMGVKQSANENDYLSWTRLFKDLKNHGLNVLPPITGTLDSHAIKGIRGAYKNFGPVRPNAAHLEKILKKVPPKRWELAKIVIESIKRTKSLDKIDEAVSAFAKYFILENPQLVIEFFNPDRDLLWINPFKTREPITGLENSPYSAVSP